MNAAEIAALNQQIDALFAGEAQAARDEHAAVQRNDHHEAALCHRRRWRYLDAAGALIERLP